jgi:DNA-binding response OmpR family regulator
MARILLVEDDRPIAQVIRRGLEADGHAVDFADEGNRGLELARKEGYDLIILDLMLPGLDGLSLCKALRAEGCRSEILMLTARDSTEDRVRGLETGADDYLPKPFHFAELRARVNALLRRERAPAAVS